MNDMVIVGDGTAQQLAALEARAAHETAAVAEGCCPVHRTTMRRADMMDDELIGGHCSQCGRYWWYDTRTGRIGRALDHDERTGKWVSPWMAGRGAAR